MKVMVAWILTDNRQLNPKCVHLRLVPYNMMGVAYSLLILEASEQALESASVNIIKIIDKISEVLLYKTNNC